MRNCQGGPLIKREHALLPFLLPAAWNENVMAAAAITFSFVRQTGGWQVHAEDGEIEDPLLDDSVKLPTLDFFYGRE